MDFIRNLFRKERRILRDPELQYRTMYPCNCKECVKIVGNENVHNGRDEEIVGPCEGKMKGWKISIPVNKDGSHRR